MATAEGSASLWALASNLYNNYLTTVELKRVAAPGLF